MKRIGVVFNAKCSEVQANRNGQSEIRQLGLAGVPDENVCRLNVAVKNALIVCVLEAAKQVHHQTLCPC